MQTIIYGFIGVIAFSLAILILCLVARTCLKILNPFLQLKSRVCDLSQKENKS